MPSQEIMSIKVRWKDIPGYEGLYLISNFGNVYSVRSNREMKTALMPDRYKHVILTKKGERKDYKIHRLVAKAFVPNPKNLPYVNHKDEIKTNNYYHNLDWCTNEYNLNYGTRSLVASMTSLNGKQSKPLKQLKASKVIKEFPSTAEAGRNGYNQRRVSYACITGKAYRGFEWQYI